MASIEIREGAIFVADSHYPHHGDEFFLLLEEIYRGERAVPQLFLMGDNFDLLFGYNSYIQQHSIKAITLLQKLSQKLEIYYFEGNHDFLLTPIFPYIKIYPREVQPVIFTIGEKRVGLSHGDRYATEIFYNLYSKILRNRYLIILLRPFEKSIINYRLKELSAKSICDSFDKLESRVDRIKRYYIDVDYIIEGHFHQAKIIDNYYSLPSLACHKKIGVLQNNSIKFINIKL
jgi:UDP-2,3-diacylglucosamine hydrolase